MTRHISPIPSYAPLQLHDEQFDRRQRAFRNCLTSVLQTSGGHAGQFKKAHLQGSKGSKNLKRAILSANRLRDSSSSLSLGGKFARISYHRLNSYGFSSWLVFGTSSRVPGVMMTSPVDLRQISYTLSGSRRM